MALIPPNSRSERPSRCPTDAATLFPHTGRSSGRNQAAYVGLQPSIFQQQHLR